MSDGEQDFIDDVVEIGIFFKKKHLLVRIEVKKNKS